jgi:hypothetical protein
MLNSYRLATTKMGVLLFDSVSARLWLWLDEATEGALELFPEGPRELDSPSDLISLSSSIGIAEENIGTGPGDAARLILSIRGSINVALEAYADCVSGPSNSVGASEYAVDPGRS